MRNDSQLQFRRNAVIKHDSPILKNGTTVSLIPHRIGPKHFQRHTLAPAQEPKPCGVFVESCPCRGRTQPRYKYTGVVLTSNQLFQQSCVNKHSGRIALWLRCYGCPNQIINTSEERALCKIVVFILTFFSYQVQAQIEIPVDINILYKELGHLQQTELHAIC